MAVNSMNSLLFCNVLMLLLLHSKINLNYAIFVGSAHFSQFAEFPLNHRSVGTIESLQKKIDGLSRILLSDSVTRESTGFYVQPVQAKIT